MQLNYTRKSLLFCSFWKLYCNDDVLCCHTRVHKNLMRHNLFNWALSTHKHEFEHKSWIYIKMWRWHTLEIRFEIPNWMSQNTAMFKDEFFRRYFHQNKTQPSPYNTHQGKSPPFKKSTNKNMFLNVIKYIYDTKTF